MSRTYRRVPHSYFRRPRGNGARRAMMETLDGDLLPAVRHRAIPPDAWEDRPVSREACGAVYRYLRNARRVGHRHRWIIARAVWRFGISHGEAAAILDTVIRYAPAPA